MEILKARSKNPPSERIICPLCDCIFLIEVSDVYETSYTNKGKIGYVNCPDCKTKLKVYGSKCQDELFSLYFSVEEIVPKHCL